MIGLSDITLLRPWWLLALVPLAVLVWVMARRRGGAGDWEAVVDPQLMQALAAMGRVDAGHGGRVAKGAIIGAVLLIIALAGPAVERRDAVAFRNLDGVVFVLDASSSVVDSPRWPQMLTMGRFGIASLGSRPAGLVVYGGDAYVATDITGDVRQLGQTLSVVDRDTMPDPGSRPERGLALARRIQQEAEILAGDVIVMTDGAGLTPRAFAEAEAIAARGARLSVISLEAPTAGIETLVQIGGGRVFTLDQTDELSDWMRTSARERLEQQDYPLLFWSDYGRWLLLLVLIPAMLLFRRRAVT